MVLEIAAINCALICQLKMKDGSLYDVKDVGTFKVGDAVMLSDDGKFLCRPMCPITEVPKEGQSILPPQPYVEPTPVRGLW